MKTAVALDSRKLSRETFITLTAATGLAVAILFARPAGAEPASTGFVYTADEHGNSVSRIDLKSGKVDIVPVDIMPHNVQFVPGKSRLLAVGLSASGSEAEGHDGGGDGASEHGGGGHEGTAATGKLVVLDTDDITSATKTSIGVGAHPAHVIADTEGNRAYVSNSEDDTVSVVDLRKDEVIATIGTGDYPHGLRMSPDGKSIYVANVEDGTISVIDTATLAEVDRVEVGSTPVQVGFVPDGSRVYVSLRDANQVAVIDPVTRKVTQRIDVGRSPIQVHATPDGRFVYVANQGTVAEPDDTVSVIDAASGTVVKTIRTGAGAHGVTVSSDGDLAFVTNIIDGTVSAISVVSQSVVGSYRVGKGPNGITYQAR
ncbi:YncE family protein [Sinorhizobium meliloti]|uniref:YncE family protein n=1 Tax=Rhizobium meliloti TaxID=382 RepID=UPI00129643EF|nr:YncE family protein [Sinorhizobium meliloti]MDW9688390.1 beta-propeller fold lactonase family protein [Sinorhizobium meliloti]MQU97073.1 beta-propeller fold lactonase family protein [Sinorhizobium meliloti]MQV12984.1 beta-propeller fold lactonase family protein [Sinorhizobium meliloti]